MSEIIKMDYPLMEEMKAVFTQGAQQLEDTAREMQNIAAALEDGALLGRGGEAFSSALRERLTLSINKLKEKFEELAQDVQGAMDDMRSADTQASGYYR